MLIVLEFQTQLNRALNYIIEYITKQAATGIYSKLYSTSDLLVEFKYILKFPVAAIRSTSELVIHIGPHLFKYFFNNKNTDLDYSMLVTKSHF
jgi:hypothetical protein